MADGDRDGGGRAPLHDAAADFEAAVARAGTETYVLRLYVCGSTMRSQQAIESIKRVCEERLPGRYDLEVVDIHQQREMAGEADILAAPTLIKQLPLPLRRLVGHLADEERVLVGLGLRPRPHPESADG